MIYRPFYVGPHINPLPFRDESAEILREAWESLDIGAENIAGPHTGTPPPSPGLIWHDEWPELESLMVSPEISRWAISAGRSMGKRMVWWDRNVPIHVQKPRKSLICRGVKDGLSENTGVRPGLECTNYD